MAETITASDGTVYDKASLKEDADGLWAQMGGALALIKPSVAFEARRKADSAAQATAQASQEKAAAREALVQAEIRALAEERLKAKGI